MTPELHPDRQRLRDHLLESLTAEASREIELHLDSCVSCQRALESIAAEDDFWNAARKHLPTTVDLDGQVDASIATDTDLLHVEHEQVQQLLSPTDDPTKIGRLGHYEIVGIVGAGATAIVLKAFDGPLNRFVAIKLLRPTLAASANARQRFSREARSAAAIVHENVIEIFGVSEDERLPYLVMPYIAGESLARRIEKTWPLPPAAMLHVACQVADGLQAAHAKGLMHRDVKPSNILLGRGVERLKLTDFGLARAVDDVGLTRTGIVAGTPEYMSPEQARGEDVDHRSDLFSLGGVLYAMCTGQPPFTSDSCYGVLRRIVEEEPRPIQELNPAVPDWMCRLVHSLMAKEPNDRPQSASQVSDTLRQCLGHVQDPSVPLPERLCVPANSALRKWCLSAAYASLIFASGFAIWHQPKEVFRARGVINETASPNAPASAAVLWDDGVEQSLQELSRELNQLESSLSPIDPLR
ncbi:MAG: serine/threonine-protein kinase [Planctomycetota bacterium]